MVSATTKRIIMGNVQLLDYCKEKRISISKLTKCNIEKIGERYFFVMHKTGSLPTMEHDIDSQPDVVLTMDASSDNFLFSNTEWTARVK